MRAGILTSARAVELATIPTPAPAPGQVLVSIEGCGVCGSDLPVWEGRPWFSYPREPGAPGHEGWGTVAALGDGVSGPAVGTRVAGLTYRAYAEFDLVDAAGLVPLPGELEHEPFPGEALGCAINVFRRSGIESGQTVAVVGVGFLGAVVTQLAARAGAEVIAISRRRTALEAARAMGAQSTLSLGPGTTEQVAEMTGGDLCDVVIEAAGTQATLDAAAPLTRVRGRLVIAGFHQDGTRQVDMQLWNWRGLDVINAHERDQERYVSGIREAARAVAEGRLDPRPLYTHRLPLTRLGHALDTARTRPEGFMKALVGT
ncbi:MAG TPA: zinc-binding dehydrogenase [Solirubrobacteraceae bacterium]|nr:zinc-binding dehydrogenase [Solirubrobacteraceae bacterium]